MIGMKALIKEVYDLKIPHIIINSALRGNYYVEDLKKLKYYKADDLKELSKVVLSEKYGSMDNLPKEEYLNNFNYEKYGKEICKYLNRTNGYFYELEDNIYF